MRKTKFGFTLAEVLITLGIIGVVSAMTIPNLITNYKAKRLKSQFYKSYSTVQQVFKQMQGDDVSLDPKTYGTAQFYKEFMKYLQAPFDCGALSSNAKKYLPCYPIYLSKKYHTLNNKTTIADNWFDDGQIALQDGSLILFENYLDQLWVSVDLNGFNNPPNRWGYDLFTFEFIDGELVTMGDLKTKYNEPEKYCNFDSGSAFNGITCGYYAKTDSTYFKKIVQKYH